MRSLTSLIVLTLLLTGCGGGISKDTELGLTLCVQVGVLDQFMQEKNSTVDYQAMLRDIYTAADNAVEFNPDKYGQLSLLVNRLEDSINRGDSKVILDLVAVENECDNLGYMP
jgi:hypothetical protein